MGIVSRIGSWLDSRFPEKITADVVLSQVAEINGRIAALDAEIARYQALSARVAELEKKAETQISEMNKAKVAFMSLRPQSSTFPHLSR